MTNINRRDFFRKAAWAATGATLSGAAMGSGPEPAGTNKITATSLRRLGKTDVHCTLLGMGTGVKAWNGQSALTRKGRETFLAVLERAWDRGIRYFDMADMYGAHGYIKHAVKHGPVERDKATFLTKTTARHPDLVRADIERFRKELDTDYLDIVLFHCLNDTDWPAKMVPCMDVLAEAKQKGVIRAHGLSTHKLDAARAAVHCDWADVVLARINHAGVKMDTPPEDAVPVLEQLHNAGKGVLGMKVVGEGQLSHEIHKSLRFVIGLGTVDAMPIGFLAPEEVDSAIEHVTEARRAL